MTVFKKILLAEDDEDDKMIFMEIVNELIPTDHVRFDAVDNGQQLIEALEENPELPDLVILDQNMPLLSGKETLEKIRKDDRFDHVPVVIYSTYNDNRLSGECYHLGATQIVTKPNSFEEFREMIKMLLKEYVHQR